MKKIVFLLIGFLLVCNIRYIQGTTSINILVDESRIEIYDSTAISLENTQSMGLSNLARKIEKIGSVEIRKSGSLEYSTLQDYDVLIIASFIEEYGRDEAYAIEKFVENGGGLLVLANPLGPNNCVSESFDVFFPPDRVVISDSEAELFDEYQSFYVADIVPHPITENVEQIAFNWGTYIFSHTAGEVLLKTGSTSWADKLKGTSEKREWAEDKDYPGLFKHEHDEEWGPFDICLALDKVGRGRAVFFAGVYSLCNWVTRLDNQQNTTLIMNAVNWLGEPGGPYKQYAIMHEGALHTVSAARSSYENRQFSQALTEFQNALDFFNQAYRMYPTSEVLDDIEETRKYILTCRTAIEAERFLQEGISFFENGQYEEALNQFELSKSRYEEINDDEGSQQAQLLIEKCETVHTANGLLKEGITYFEQQQYGEAIGKFDEARSLFFKVENQEKIEECENWIAICEKEIQRAQEEKDEQPEEEEGGFCGGTIILLIHMLIGIIIVRKRKKIG